MDLGAEHDACEEGEEESFKHAHQGEDEGKGARENAITPLKVTSNTTKEKPCHHPQAKHRHRHDVELCVHVCAHVCMHVCVCMCMCVHVCVHVCDHDVVHERKRTQSCRQLESTKLTVNKTKNF